MIDQLEDIAPRHWRDICAEKSAGTEDVVELRQLVDDLATRADSQRHMIGLLQKWLSQCNGAGIKCERSRRTLFEGFQILQRIMVDASKSGAHKKAAWPHLQQLVAETVGPGFIPIDFEEAAKQTPTMVDA